MLIDSIQRLTRHSFFNRSEPAEGAWQIIAWWEVRRIPYNIIVGTVGVITCGLCLVTAILTERFEGEALGLPNPPFFAVFAVVLYGVMANVCFTGGWIAELIARKLCPGEGRAFGKISFFFGLVFSMFLTLAPGVLLACVGALVLLRHAFAS